MSQLKAYTDEFINVSGAHERYMGMMRSRVSYFDPILSGEELCTKEKISELENQVLQLNQLLYVTKNLNTQLQGMENPNAGSLIAWKKDAELAIELRDKGVENLALVASWIATTATP